MTHSVLSGYFAPHGKSHQGTCIRNQHRTKFFKKMDFLKLLAIPFEINMFTLFDQSRISIYSLVFNIKKAGQNQHNQIRRKKKKLVHLFAHVFRIDHIGSKFPLQK